MSLARQLCVRLTLASQRRGASSPPHRVSRRLLATSSVVCQQNIVRSPYEDVTIPSGMVHDYIFEFCGKFANYTAFECGVTGRKYTFDDIRTRSRNLSTALRKKLKLQQNDVVAVFLPNVPEYPIVIFGCLLSGLKVTTLNPLYTPDEISRQLKDCNAKALVTIPELHANAKTATNGTQIPIIAIPNQAGVAIPNGTINFSELVNERLDVPDLKLDDQETVSFMPYSSGTTGLPKGVQLTHRNMLANMRQINSKYLNLYTEASESHQDCLPAVLPFFHIYGFNSTMLASTQDGVKIVTLPKFTPDLYLQTLKKYKPNLLVVVPPIVIFLTLHPEITTKDLQCVTAMMSGAAPLGSLDEERFLEKAQNPNLHIAQGYGLSETSPVVCLTPKGKGNPKGTIGTVVPNTSVKVVPLGKSASEAVGPNEKGELFVKGPQVMKGYHNRPEETKNSFEDGWFKTGDMVYYDEKGFFYITDRIKELIKVKGFQVPPAELEELLRDHPDVSDAAVIGVPHPIHGEVPRAYVVPKKANTVDTDKLAGFVAEKVAPYKKLAGGVVVVEAIPKNASGKIMRRVLRMQYDKENQE